MLNRRLQVLIDEDRWERLQRRSAETGASVGELVRRAIDAGLPVSDHEREAAAASFLAAAPMPVEDWEDMKREMLDNMGPLPE